jgi:hypothetical protein
MSTEVKYIDPLKTATRMSAEFDQAIRSLAFAKDLNQFKRSPIAPEAKRRLEAAIAQRRGLPEMVADFKPITPADVEYEARRLRARRALVVWRPQP